MLRWVLLLMSALLAFHIQAQTNAVIKELEKQREALLKEIKASELLLDNSAKSIGAQLKNLSAIEAQITRQKKYITRLEQDAKAVDGEIRELEAQIKTLELELDKAKDEYAKSLRYIRSNRSIQEKLMFIFSAPSLPQIYRRARYLNEYSSYRKTQADVITVKRDSLLSKENQMKEVVAEKKKLLEETAAEQAALENKQAAQKKQLAQLQRKQSEIRNEVAQQKRKSDELNRKIDQLVQEEIERIRREEEAKAKAKESMTDRGVQMAESGTTHTSPTASAERKLSDDFEQNKGALPAPVTTPYLVVSHYGLYNVAGLRNVQLDNKGIDLQAQPEAMARAVFKGEVSAVFEYAGMKGILIRHGKYISVYCNLSTVLVKQGDTVETKQEIGKIYSNPSDGYRTVLHFQLRKETEKLNPEEWIES